MKKKLSFFSKIARTDFCVQCSLIHFQQLYSCEVANSGRYIHNWLCVEESFFQISKVFECGRSDGFSGENWMNFFFFFFLNLH